MGVTPARSKTSHSSNSRPVAPTGGDEGAPRRPVEPHVVEKQDGARLDDAKALHQRHRRALGVALVQQRRRADDVIMREAANGQQRAHRDPQRQETDEAPRAIAIALPRKQGAETALAQAPRDERLEIIGTEERIGLDAAVEEIAPVLAHLREVVGGEQLRLAVRLRSFCRVRPEQELMQPA